jgi:nicotinate dehydrogenase subunit A
LWSVEGHDVTTIEGIGDGRALHPVQQAFIDHQAAQCGYCSSGIVMAAVALLREVPDPTDAQIVAALERNLCRCGAQARVLRAIRAAAVAMARSPKP